jgi:desulfoferrodoxin-like iron-binding protein
MYCITSVYYVNQKSIVRRKVMNVEKEGENYRCNICGNEVTVTKAGGGELVCCGEPMERF